MYNSKFYGYVINSNLKKEKSSKLNSEDEPDFQKIGLCGIINYLNSENPNKSYFGLNAF